MKNLIAFLLVLPTIAPGQTALTTAQIAKRVSPAVVVIQGKTDSGELQGSGFIISKDGKIVTNLHVIRNLNTAKVQLADGRVFDSVAVLGTDEKRDLAIIKVAGLNFPILALGNSDTLTVGEPIVVVGSPLGLDSTVTAGILSAVRDSGEGFKLLQTDAAVNHGNSGGPLVNASGLAIGVVSSILRSESAQGLNFAIPINSLRELMGILHEPITVEQMRKTLSVPFVQQTAEPTLKETLEWLKEKISLGGTQFVTTFDGLTISFNVQDKAWQFDSCNVELGQIVAEKAEGTPTVIITTRYSLPLGVLTGGSVELRDNSGDDTGARTNGGEQSSYWLFLQSKSKEILETVTTSLEAIPPTSSSKSFVRLEFRDEAIAKRIYEAFHHATDLCRKKEPF